MLAGWSQQKIITIDPNAVDETLPDFTICVVLTSANFDFSLARPDGYDIRFTATDGNTLFKYERVSHDATAELAEYHFRVLPLTDSSVFRMFYGNPDAPDVADKEAAWSDNDVMVHHMNDASVPDTEHVVNGNMEADSDWLSTGAPDTNIQSDEQSHNGEYSRKVVTTATGIANNGIYQSVDLVVGKAYRVTGYLYLTAVSNYVRIYWNSQSIGTTSVTGSWIKIEKIVTYAAGPSLMIHTLKDDSATFYVDDVSITEVTRTITDSTSNDNDGTKKGGNEPIEAAGQIGEAQDFDGDDYITIPYQDCFNFTNFGISLWVKMNDDGIIRIFLGAGDITGSGSERNYWHIRREANNKIRFIVSADGDANYDLYDTVSTITTASGWTHLAATYIPSTRTMKVYINDIEEGQSTTSAGETPEGTTDDLFIGDWAFHGVYNHNGAIDEVRISNTIRSVAWRKANHHNLNGTLFTMTDAPREAISLSGSMTPSGGITSITNPEWIPIDDRLRWVGEWDATYVYAVGDVVMYKTADGRYHGWLSRTTHNVGNIPTTSYAHWARIIQAKWKR